MMRSGNAGIIARITRFELQRKRIMNAWQRFLAKPSATDVDFDFVDARTNRSASPRPAPSNTQVRIADLAAQNEPNQRAPRYGVARTKQHANADDRRNADALPYRRP